MAKKNMFKESEFKKGEKSLKISFLILGMFLIAQIIGLLIIAHGEVPEVFQNSNDGDTGLGMFISMAISFILAITIFFFLIQYKWKSLIRVWFSLVILLTISISVYTLFHINGLSGNKFFVYSMLIALPFVLLKILRPSVIIHNLTEVFVYAGLSMIFVNLFSPISVIALLIAISLYDMWAVWHSGIMQKMAKFQMNEVKIFNGFLIPYLSPMLKKKINQTNDKKKREKIKVPIAILGGGDIAFTMIPAGVFLKSFGWIPALFVVLGGFLGLSYLMLRSNKKRFYPAMPFITLGIFTMILLYFLLGFIGIL